jgi:TatD DNase family protein
MPQFEEDLPEVIQRATQHNVGQIITVGTNLELSGRAVKLTETYPEVFAAVGIHPHGAAEFNGTLAEELKDLADHPKVVAIGEMGLDFYRNLSPPDRQIDAFRKQIRLARQLKKPIIVHARDAYAQVLNILKEEKGYEWGGVIHCYNGDLSKALECLDMGFYISIPGSITFRNAARLRNVVLHLPLDRLLVETDSPFLAPIPFRGKRNEPAYIRYIAERLAKIRKIPLDELSEATYQNTRELFHLPPITATFTAQQ